MGRQGEGAGACRGRGMPASRTASGHVEVLKVVTIWVRPLA